jgi:hypothetical protein
MIDDLSQGKCNLTEAKLIINAPKSELDKVLRDPRLWDCKIYGTNRKPWFSLAKIRAYKKVLELNGFEGIELMEARPTYEKVNGS